MKNIVIITDCRDVAVEQIKAKLIALTMDACNFHVVLVDPFQVRSGAFLAKLISEEISHGQDTMFLAVVNPVREKPKRIFGRLNNGTWFVGADTGFFSLLMDDFGVAEIFESNVTEHFPFGGLHVHAVSAGKLLKGDRPDDLGKRIAPEAIKRISLCAGEVVHIDNFGLVKIWNTAGDFNFFKGEAVNIQIKGSDRKFKAIFSNRMMNFDDGTLVVYPGSSLLNKSKIHDVEAYRASGLLEIGLVRMTDTAGQLGIKLQDIIEITKFL